MISVALAVALAFASTPDAGQVPRALDDGMVSQVATGLSTLSGDVRTSYLLSAASGAVDGVTRDEDMLLSKLFSRSFETCADDCVRSYREHVERERKKQEEAERKRAEEAEAARLESEVGDNIAWLAAHVATGAPDVGGTVSRTGSERVDDSRCIALYQLMDATLGAAGVAFDDTDESDVVCAVLVSICDADLISSGDAQGGREELLAHVSSSDAYERAEGDPRPGDVVFWGSHVGIYVGADAANEAVGSHVGSVLACDARGNYPSLVSAPGAYDFAFRPKASSGMGIDWRDAVSRRYWHAETHDEEDDEEVISEWPFPVEGVPANEDAVENETVVVDEA